MASGKDLSYKQELLRKAIHLNSLSIPIIYSFISKELALKIIIPLTVLGVLVDLLANFSESIKHAFRQIFGKILRPHEKSGKFIFNGATWVLLSASITILVFPKIIAITAFAILIISDLSAALIGRKFGRHRLFTKSWEGMAAFIVSADLVIFVIGSLSGAPLSYYLLGIIAAIIGGIVEAASSVLKMDDNLSIPITIGIVMWAGSYAAPWLNLEAYHSLL